MNCIESESRRILIITIKVISHLSGENVFRSHLPNQTTSNFLLGSPPNCHTYLLHPHSIPTFPNINLTTLSSFFHLTYIKVSSTMPLSIKAKCFNGQAYDLAIDQTSPTVNDLQSCISTASGITPDRQTILFKGQVLESGKPLSSYSLSDGNIVSVMRRIGKPSSKPSTSSTNNNTNTTSNNVPSSSIGRTDTEQAAAQPPSLEEMMRAMNMGGSTTPGIGSAPPIPDLASLMGGATGASGAPGAGAMEQIFAQLPQMMNGLLQTPLVQEYLNDPEKQEQSRTALLNNPVTKKMLDSDPEFAKVVNDPDQWRASMNAAKTLLKDDDTTNSNTQENSTDRSIGVDSTSRNIKTRAASKKSAADLAPANVDFKKLSEAYGHAFGQSLVNSGLGLDPDLVIKGLRSAVDGRPFPMVMAVYERSMALVQNIATDFLREANLEDANNFFEELKQSKDAVVIEEGKIAYEKGDEETDTSLPSAETNATVLVIVTTRLLDGRHFFTCPAADDSGESLHPLTLGLDTAPKALAKGIIGMHENESRQLYVHPSACEGMADMFGDLIPPNALLIFDLQLVSANAPDEDEAEGDGYDGR